MRVLAVGAGVLGLLFGAYLSEAGNEVHLVDTDPEVIAQIRKQGIRVLEPLTPRIKVMRDVEAFLPDEVPGEAYDLVLLLVKTWSTEEAVSQTLAHAGRIRAWLTLQNGLGRGPALAQLVSEGDIYVGCTWEGGVTPQPAVLDHNVSGKTFLGVQRGSFDFANILQIVLTEAGFQAQACSEIEPRLWDKALLNLTVNPLTTVLGVANGQLAECDAGIRLMAMLANEVLQVGKTKQRFDPDDDLNDRLNALLEHLQGDIANNPSTMLRDLRSHGRTEIDALSMALVDEARSVGLEAPVNEAIALLVRFLERSGRRLGPYPAVEST